MFNNFDPTGAEVQQTIDDQVRNQYLCAILSAAAGVPGANSEFLAAFAWDTAQRLMAHREANTPILTAEFNSRPPPFRDGPVTPEEVAESGRAAARSMMDNLGVSEQARALGFMTPEEMARAQAQGAGEAIQVNLQRPSDEHDDGPF